MLEIRMVTHGWKLLGRQYQRIFEKTEMFNAL